MSKRVYHLTIEYDNETEEIDYIVETVEQVDGETVQLTQLGHHELKDYFDEEDVKAILEAYEIGEA